MNELVTQDRSTFAMQAGHTVLGERPVSIPTCGTIRPGIKVLTKAYAGNKKAVEIYKDGMAKGLRNKEIEKLIRAGLELKDDAPSMLVPKNVDYFTARPGDFDNPGTATRILELYGEDRGLGRKLYRLPVVFPTDYWQVVLPHSLGVYTRNEKVFWSAYRPDGTRVCMTHAPIEIDPKSKRAARPWGGRPVREREENGGVCDPEKCPQYQNDLCKLSGKLIFYIPGVTGAGAIQLPLTSYYGLDGIRRQLELMKFACGRFSGLKPDGTPLFYLTKRYEEVPKFNRETGKTERVPQYIVRLEADVEMAKLFMPPPAAQPQLAQQAVAALEHSAAPAADPPAEEAVTGVLIEGETEDGKEPGELSVKELRGEIAQKVAKLDLSLKDDFSPYAAVKWGAKWSIERDALSKALDELNGVENAELYASVVRDGASRARGA